LASQRKKVQINLGTGQNARQRNFKASHLVKVINEGNLRGHSLEKGKGYRQTAGGVVYTDKNGAETGIQKHSQHDRRKKRSPPKQNASHRQKEEGIKNSHSEKETERTSWIWKKNSSSGGELKSGEDSRDNTRERGLRPKANFEIQHVKKRAKKRPGESNNNGGGEERRIQYFEGALGTALRNDLLRQNLPMGEATRYRRIWKLRKEGDKVGGQPTD